MLLLVLFLASPLASQETEVEAAGSLDAPIIRSQAAALIDASTGTLLFAKNHNEPIPPASLTKLMTIHVALSLAAERGLSLDEPFSPPRQSWAINQPPRSSLMFLAAGQRVTLRELLLGLAIPSGNDAAAATALLFSPSIEEFASLMNTEALAFGLETTHFVEPSGISEYNMTTALEFAQFCRRYIALHPETLREYHSVKEFAYPKPKNVAEAYRDDPGTIVQYNHNTLLGKFQGVDGLKTGYIDEAGYNIALTGVQGRTRLIGIILGAPAEWGGERIRDEDGERLLSWGFENFQTLRIEAGPFEEAKIWKGNKNRVSMVPGRGFNPRNPEDPEELYTLTFTARQGRGEGLRYEVIPEDPLIAPLPAGSPGGTLILYDIQGELQRLPLLTAEDIEEGHLLKRLWDSFILALRGLASAIRSRL